MLLDQLHGGPGGRDVALVGLGRGHAVKRRVTVEAADDQLGIRAAWARQDPFHQHRGVHRLVAQVGQRGPGRGRGEQVTGLRVRRDALAGQVHRPHPHPVPVTEPQLRQRAGMGGEFGGHLERRDRLAGLRIGVGGHRGVGAAVQRHTGPRGRQAPAVPPRDPLVDVQVGARLRHVVRGRQAVLRPCRVVGRLHDRQLGETLLVGHCQRDRAMLAEPVAAVPPVQRTPLGRTVRPHVQPVAADEVARVERARRGAALQHRLERLVIPDGLQQLLAPLAGDKRDPARTQCGQDLLDGRVGHRGVGDAVGQRHRLEQCPVDVDPGQPEVLRVECDEAVDDVALRELVLLHRGRVRGRRRGEDAGTADVRRRQLPQHRGIRPGPPRRHGGHGQRQVAGSCGRRRAQPGRHLDRHDQAQRRQQGRMGSQRAERLVEVQQLGEVGGRGRQRRGAGAAGMSW